VHVLTAATSATCSWRCVVVIGEVGADRPDRGARLMLNGPDLTAKPSYVKLRKKLVHVVIEKAVDTKNRERSSAGSQPNSEKTCRVQTGR
jgi:hypothetical protein